MIARVPFLRETIFLLVATPAHLRNFPGLQVNQPKIDGDRKRGVTELRVQRGVGKRKVQVVKERLLDNSKLNRQGKVHLHRLRHVLLLRGEVGNL